MPANCLPHPRAVRLRWGLWGLVALLSLLARSSQATAQATSSQGQVPIESIGDGNQADKISILAVVNGESITRQQLAQECLYRYGIEALQAMVNRQLIFNESQRLGIQVTAQEVEQEIERMASKFSLPKDRWLEVLERERGVPLDRYRQMVWMDLSLRQIAQSDLQIDPAEIEKMLEAEIGPAVQVRMISLQSRSQAEEVLSLAKANPDDFGRLAKEYSKDRNSASSRGLIPPIRRHVGDPTLEEVVFQMEEGEISDIVEVAAQFLIVKCERHIEPRSITLEQRREAEMRIRDFLVNKKLDESAGRLLKDLQSRVEVVNVYNDPELSQQMPGVAAIVDSARLTMRELSEECIARFGVEVLNGEINRTLLKQHLKAAQRQVTEEDLQQEIERAAEANGFLKTDGTPDIDAWLNDVLEADGATVDLYVRDAVWPSVALKKLVDDSVKVTEEDLQKGFEANYGKRVEVLAIVMQSQRMAQRVWQMATDNPTPEKFGELASQYSEEPASKANFGRVPPIARNGGQPQLEVEAFRLKKGEISGLINVGSSWVILMCLGHTEPIVTELEDVRDELYQHIREQKLRIAMADEFESIYASAHIDNFLTGSTKSPETPRSAQANGPGALPFRPRN